MILRICCLFVFIQTVDSIMCYFCTDTSNLDGRNQCQTWHRTMRHYRRKYEKTGSYTIDKYVKNCSEYGGIDSPKYCMVAQIDEGEHTRTFIRDCSDGTSFFSDDVDVYLQNQKVKPDNQTSCEALTSLGITACVTLCGYNEFGVGDFCNGPFDTSKGSSFNRNAALFSILAALIFFK
ncbi:uncharacterized protein LOC132734844 [Ruditapes philippinarum]|uniref:uncharacterized protein LOC132734844 n=1 Tax=Ruditapes philippinarum TaxID=129788 RepID=UPI00295B9EBF|nr:uncharacterized protein LOC132734844 [Ruditapes philippinarum]